MTTGNCCPNCGAERPLGEAGCRACGWIPLRETELMFLDGPLLIDEQGRAQETGSCLDDAMRQPDLRRISQSSRPRTELESLAPHSSTFHLSTIMLLTAWAGVCFALARLAIPLGVVVLVLTGLAILRTALLVGERKRYRYAVDLNTLLWFFWYNLAGVVLGCIVFGAVAFMGGMVLSGVFSVVFALLSAEEVLLFAMVALSAGASAVASTRVIRSPQRRAMYWGGGLSAVLLGAVLSAITVAGGSAIHPELLWCLPLMAGGFTCLTLACRRGGAVRVRSFLIGYSAGFSLVSAVSLVISSQYEVMQGVAAVCTMISLVAWPTLATTLTLESLWSWEDAFPLPSRPLRLVSPPAPSETSTAEKAGATEGIDFQS